MRDWVDTDFDEKNLSSRDTTEMFHDWMRGEKCYQKGHIMNHMWTTVWGVKTVLSDMCLWRPGKTRVLPWLQEPAARQGVSVGRKSYEEGPFCYQWRESLQAEGDADFKDRVERKQSKKNDREGRKKEGRLGGRKRERKEKIKENLQGTQTLTWLNTYLKVPYKTGKMKLPS